jgi:hypothetical protein
MIRIALISIGILALFSVLHAQPTPVTRWTRTVGGDTSDWADDVLQTADGGYLAVGTTYSYDIGGGDVYAVKLDSSGSVRWSRTYGSIYHNDGRLICPTPDGSYLIAGSTESYDGANWNIYLLKINTTGVQQWTHTISNQNFERPYAIKPTLDDGYIIVSGSPYNDDNVHLHKISETGSAQWSRELFQFPGAVGKSVSSTLDDGYVIAGITAQHHGFLAKTNSQGVSIWSRTYSGQDTDGFNAVKPTEDGGYLLIGYAKPFGQGNGLWIVKTDSLGYSVWDRHWGNTTNWEGRKFEFVEDGNFVVAGRADTSFMLARFDSAGNRLWYQTYAAFAPAYYDGLGFVVTRDQSYVLAGTKHTFSGGEDLYVVKTGRDQLSASVDPVTVPRQFSLSVFPNPFNPQTTISFVLPKREFVRLSVFDVTGRKISIPDLSSPTYYVAGEHRVVFDGVAFPSGIYFLQVKSESISQTRKMVLLK